ncbi:MAG: hypothetical protein PXX73_05615, partial [Sideroxydans sp.]|nr:hypothetical protein [Sideroxydans sp.]
MNYSPALSTGTCSPEQFNLTLNSASGDIEPSGTKALSVQVVNSVTHAPKADAKVRVTLDVQSGSGGHEHHDASRPKGSLTGCAPAGNGVYECITGADGLANFNFNASIVSGTHSVNAACSNLTCVNQPSPVTVDVKVAGLLPIPASQFYSLTEPIGGGGFKSVGASDSHHNNHYLTATASNELWRITAQYHFEQRFKLAGNIAPPVWYLNDASLAWGGVFDIKNNWSKPHVEHRRGGSIDVRA